jgi:excisionase family DNA binding protein
MVSKLLKGTQVAELLNISRSKAYGMMKRAEIPTIKFGKSVRVQEEDLEKFILIHHNIEENK